MSKPQSAELNYSPALLGLIITLFVIIALLGAGLALMIRQVTAYRDDVANYHVSIERKLFVLMISVCNAGFERG